MVEITILNRRSELGRVVALLDAFGAEHRLAPPLVADMQVALDEVLSNVTQHAHPDQSEHSIHVRLRMVADALEAEIEDDGLLFNPLSAPLPDLRARLRDRHVGGLGIEFIRNLMDDVIYERAGDRNRLVLRLRRKS
jgi:anti-sigma regulatory factor (Ser/Thr protein kinase)